MSLTWVRTHGARAAVLALSAPLLLAAPAPASTAHPMAPAVDSESQFEFSGDFQPDQPTLPPCLNSNPIGCFGPAAIRAAYDIQPLMQQGIDGAGSTIVIIDAYQNPSIESDLALFDSLLGIPAPKSFTKLAPFGTPPLDPTPKKSWSKEISIDVEWAHATAPGAAIVLVQSLSSDDADMVNATQFAVDHNLGDVITQSFGEAEMCASAAVLDQQHAVFQKAAGLGITVFASSGDQGAARKTCDGNGVVFGASTPASDPEVTGVGGTHLVAGAGGAYMSETAWNSDPIGASGGGFSTLFRRPGYQASLQKDNNKARGVPDVAYNASIASPFLAVWMGHGAFAAGTSAGTPQWAGIIALADQAAGRRLGSINRWLYHIAKSDAYSSAFHDVTSGNNNFVGILGFKAAPGWDAVTGLGTPRVANLIPLLIAAEDGD